MFVHVQLRFDTIQLEATVFGDASQAYVAFLAKQPF